MDATPTPALSRPPASGEAVRIAAARVVGSAVEVRWGDGHVSRFHHVWLRDNCPLSRHPKSGHRLFETADIPRDIAPESLEVENGETLRVVWNESAGPGDGRKSAYAAGWLRTHCYSRGERERRRPRPKPWERETAEGRPVFDFRDLGGDERRLYAMLSEVRDHGFARLAGVPARRGAIRDAVQLFGYIRETNYGTVFDVESVPDADHLAYTARALGMHTDNPYRDHPPDLQFLHCLESTAKGGDSVLVDGFRVAEALRVENPRAFGVLCRIPASFQLAGGGVDLRSRAPVIQLDEWGAVQRVRFSNRAAAPLEAEEDLVPAFYAALRAFAETAERASFKFTFRMEPGDLYIVDNGRVLHGRTAFDESAGGHRLLQGCYADRDGLASRLRVFAGRFEPWRTDGAVP